MIDIVLFCPNCGLQHIDRAESFGSYVSRVAGDASKERWTNPPHKTHLCRADDGGCGALWRPSDTPTNGVERTESGKDDPRRLIDANVSSMIRIPTQRKEQ